MVEQGRRSVLLVLLAVMAGGCATPVWHPPGQSAVTRPLRTASAEGDEGIPPGYYKGTEGLRGEALLEALHDIIDDQKDLGYDEARDILFDKVSDPGERDIVEDLYTGKEVGDIHDRRSAYDRGLNTEHTWPQSLGAVGPAQSDLHHLRPSDIKINGSRASYPYGEVKGTEFLSWPSVDGDSNRLGNGRAGYLVFQPRARVRGDIARGLLYFYTRYAVGGGQVDLRNFRLEAPYIVKWNREDPVDAGEKARNDAIFKIQGNRNPFVDHPEWVNAVGLTG